MRKEGFRTCRMCVWHNKTTRPKPSYDQDYHFAVCIVQCESPVNDSALFSSCQLHSGSLPPPPNEAVQKTGTGSDRSPNTTSTREFTASPVPTGWSVNVADAVTAAPAAPLPASAARAASAISLAAATPRASSREVMTTRQP